MAEWVTKRVRAYNVRAGDVVDVWNLKRQRPGKLTVQWVDARAADRVDIGFRRRLFGWRLKRNQLVRVRRREAKR